MKRILSLILSVFALNTWGQVSVQVQTQSKNYDFSDAYRITFEEGGATQVIHSRSKGEVRIPMSDLKQIHFNDTTVNLVHQIMNLDNCEIMNCIFAGKVPNLSADILLAYMNSPMVTQIFIPNDDAFQIIPYKMGSTNEIVSVTLVSGNTFPLKAQRYNYDYETGQRGRAVLNGELSEEETVKLLQRLIFNQMVLGNQKNAYTVAGSELETCDGEYKGTYQKNALKKGWTEIPMVHVVQTLPGAEGKSCMVTDACVHESISGTYEALQEIAPSFLSLMMDVPLDIFINPIYFESSNDGNRFFWASSKVGYTIFAPSDEAMASAVNNGDVYTWDMIMEKREDILASEGSKTVIDEMIEKTFAFINRHICFRNAMVEVTPGSSVQMVSCNMMSDGLPQLLSVRRESDSDVLEILDSQAKTDPESIFYVREPWDISNENVISSSEYSVGVVIRIDKAIVDEN